MKKMIGLSLLFIAFSFQASHLKRYKKLIMMSTRYCSATVGDLQKQLLNIQNHLQLLRQEMDKAGSEKTRREVVDGFQRGLAILVELQNKMTERTKDKTTYQERKPLSQVVSDVKEVSSIPDIFQEMVGSKK